MQFTNVSDYYGILKDLPLIRKKTRPGESITA